MGGHHPSILPEVTISNSAVDIIVKGQGEYTFKELVNELSIKNGELRAIDGIVYKSESAIHYNNDRGILKKNDLPQFPWHLIDVRKYVRSDPKIGSRILNYVSSQGCPFPCTFCSEVSMYKRKWVSYGCDRIINDIRYLIDEAKINSIKFYDANFFVHLPTVLNFSRVIKEMELCISWAASGHPRTLNSLDNDTFSSLKDSGCSRLLIGVKQHAKLSRVLG